MPAAVNPISLPFREAIAYFLQKLNVPTDWWVEVWAAQHETSFMVAGALQAELVEDFRQAIAKAVSQGTGYKEWVKDFDRIVAERGWTGWTGEESEARRAWRTRVIYDTNMQQAYNAGREAQMQDPELRKRAPYGLYVHSDFVRVPREEHLAWDGWVIPLDDPWWETHSPQNGWGCKCKKYAITARGARRRGLTIREKAPPVRMVEHEVPGRGTVRLPEGITPGFEYAPGAARVAQVRAALEGKLEQFPAPIRERLKEQLDSIPSPPDAPTAEQ